MLAAARLDGGFGSNTLSACLKLLLYDGFGTSSLLDYVISSFCPFMLLPLRFRFEKFGEMRIYSMSLAELIGL